MASYNAVLGANAAGRSMFVIIFSDIDRMLRLEDVWIQDLRHCFITVPDRKLMLPTSLNTRLVDHALPQDITEGYAADWIRE